VSYDEKLSDRVRKALGGRDDVAFVAEARLPKAGRRRSKT